jgi:hypothetical protein
MMDEQGRLVYLDFGLMTYVDKTVMEAFGSGVSAHLYQHSHYTTATSLLTLTLYYDHISINTHTILRPPLYQHSHYTTTTSLLTLTLYYDHISINTHTILRPHLYQHSHYTTTTSLLTLTLYYDHVPGLEAQDLRGQDRHVAAGCCLSPLHSYQSKCAESGVCLTLSILVKEKKQAHTNQNKLEP